ncbi:MAG: hypothetical protein K9M96_06950 [Deltaproteobacteria bacterium]|nr:hypothetical protein [Deltaproteobacteria bacterium]MCF8120076.1 hypothetical protein [Deltaproteobacteria bacterium]
MKRGKMMLGWSIVFLAAAALSLGGGVGATADAAEKCFPCTDVEKIEKHITPKAQLEDLSCYMKKWKGAEVLHFKVSLKNVTDTPQRYRVQIFLDNGKAVGGLIPRKTKKGLVKPGQVVDFAYPVKGMAEKPETVLLRVTCAGS